MANIDSVQTTSRVQRSGRPLDKKQQPEGKVKYVHAFNSHISQFLEPTWDLWSRGVKHKHNFLLVFFVLRIAFESG